jgi:hypothetical protein
VNVSSVHPAQAVAVPAPRRLDIKRLVPAFALAAGLAIGATTVAILDDGGTTTARAASVQGPLVSHAHSYASPTAHALSPDAADAWTARSATASITLALPATADAAERWTTASPATPSVPSSADAAERWTTTDTTSVPSSPDAAERWID